MASRFLLFLGLVFLISLPARAQDQVELFGGYSFERFGGSSGANSNGVEFSGQYKFFDWLGGVADVDAHFASPSGVSFKTLNVMFGPQLSFPARVSPFVHVLAGVGHISVGGVTDNSFATAVGGGIDMRVAPMLSWRVVQADDVVTRLFGQTQNSARISTGIVFRF